MRAALVLALFVLVATPSGITISEAEENTQRVAALTVIDSEDYELPLDTTLVLAGDTLIHGDSIRIAGEIRAEPPGGNAPNLYLIAAQVNVTGTIHGADGGHGVSVRAPEEARAGPGGHGGGVFISARSIHLEPTARILLGGGGNGGAAHAIGLSPLAIGGDGGHGGFLLLDGEDIRLGAVVRFGQGGDAGSARSEQTRPSYSTGDPGGAGAYGGTGGTDSFVLAPRGNATGQAALEALSLDWFEPASLLARIVGLELLAEQSLGPNVHPIIETFFAGTLDLLVPDDKSSPACQAPSGAPATSIALGGTDGPPGVTGSPGHEGGNGGQGGPGTRGGTPGPAYGGAGGSSSTCKGGDGGHASTYGGNGGRGGRGGDGGTGVNSGGFAGSGHFGMAGGGGGYAEGGKGGNGGHCKGAGKGGNANSYGGDGGGGGRGGDGGWGLITPRPGGAGGGAGVAGDSGTATRGSGGTWTCVGDTNLAQPGSQSSTAGSPGSPGASGSAGEFPVCIGDMHQCPSGFIRGVSIGTNVR